MEIRSRCYVLIIGDLHCREDPCEAGSFRLDMALARLHCGLRFQTEVPALGANPGFTQSIGDAKEGGTIALFLGNAPRKEEALELLESVSQSDYSLVEVTYVGHANYQGAWDLQGGLLTVDDWNNIGWSNVDCTVRVFSCSAEQWGCIKEFCPALKAEKGFAKAFIYNGNCNAVALEMIKFAQEIGADETMTMLKEWVVEFKMEQTQPSDRFASGLHAESYFLEQLNVVVDKLVGFYSMRGKYYPARPRQILDQWEKIENLRNHVSETKSPLGFEPDAFRKTVSDLARKLSNDFEDDVVIGLKGSSLSGFCWEPHRSDRTWRAGQSDYDFFLVSRKLFAKAVHAGVGEYEEGRSEILDLKKYDVKRYTDLFTGLYWLDDAQELLFQALSNGVAKFDSAKSLFNWVIHRDPVILSQDFYHSARMWFQVNDGWHLKLGWSAKEGKDGVIRQLETLLGEESEHQELLQKSISALNK